MYSRMRCNSFSPGGAYIDFYVYASLSWGWRLVAQRYPPAGGFLCGRWSAMAVWRTRVGGL